MVGYKNGHNSSPFLYPHLFALWPWTYSHQEVQSTSPSLISGPTPWFALASRMWQMWPSARPQPTPWEVLCASCLRNLLSYHVRKARLACWTAETHGADEPSQQVQRSWGLRDVWHGGRAGRRPDQGERGKNGGRRSRDPWKLRLPVLL